MKLQRKFLLAFLLVPIFVLSFSSIATATSFCQRVYATGVGQDNFDGTTQAKIYGFGVLVGTTTASFAPTGQNGNVLSLGGDVVFKTYHATLTVTVSGTADLSTGEFTLSGPVTSATGLLKRTTGNLTFNGVEDFVRGSFTERITGTLCLG
jgi:hypothetical protein